MTNNDTLISYFKLAVARRKRYRTVRS